jgi:hypothetical protein
MKHEVNSQTWTVLQLYPDVRSLLTEMDRQCDTFETNIASGCEKHSVAQDRAQSVLAS